MSKSTQKYGKVTFTARLTSETNPQPSKKLLRQWARLDNVALKTYGKKYDLLNDKEQVAVCLEINIERQRDRNRQAMASHEVVD